LKAAYWFTIVLLGLLAVIIWGQVLECRGDDLTNRIRSQITKRLDTNPAMIQPLDLYRLAEADLMLKMAEKVEKGEINQESFNFALRCLEGWAATRSQ
jgi:hypothetical protein